MLSSNVGSTTFVVAALLAARASAGTITVGPAGSGAQFTDIQPAVDAALPGDRILVQPGVYSGFVVDGKPLAILGPGSALARVDTLLDVGVEVRNLPAGTELSISGLEIHAWPIWYSDPYSIWVRDCAGTVVLSDVLVDHPQSQVGLRAEACARVLLLDSEILSAGQPERGAVQAGGTALWIANCTVSGEDSTTTGFSAAGGHGVELEGSELLVWRSVIRGGDADSAKPTFGVPEPGGIGIAAAGSSITVFGGPGSAIAGGDGTTEPFFGTPSAGGIGIVLQFGSSLRFQAQVPLTGGFDGSGTVEAPAVAVEVGSTLDFEPEIFASLAASPPQLAAGGQLALALAGHSFGVHFVFAAGATGPDLALSGVEGLGCLDLSSLALVAIVPLDAFGSGSLLLAVPSDPTLVGATPLLQSVEAAGAVISISNPALAAITG